MNFFVQSRQQNSFDFELNLAVSCSDCGLQSSTWGVCTMPKSAGSGWCINAVSHLTVVLSDHAMLFSSVRYTYMQQAKIYNTQRCVATTPTGSSKCLRHWHREAPKFWNIKLTFAGTRQGRLQFKCLPSYNKSK